MNASHAKAVAVSAAVISVSPRRITPRSNGLHPSLPALFVLGLLMAATDAIALPVINAENVVVDGGAGFAEFVVRLSAPSSDTESGVYFINPGSAVRGIHFDFINTTTLSFAPGETVKTVRRAHR